MRANTHTLSCVIAVRPAAIPCTAGCILKSSAVLQWSMDSLHVPCGVYLCVWVSARDSMTESEQQKERGSTMSRYWKKAAIKEGEMIDSGTICSFIVQVKSQHQNSSFRKRRQAPVHTHASWPKTAFSFHLFNRFGSASVYHNDRVTKVNHYSKAFSIMFYSHIQYSAIM